MAAAIARRLFADRGDVDIASAGTHAYDGDPAYPLAVDTAANHGLDLSEHRARRLGQADVVDADLIFAMTKGHEDALRNLDPGANVRCLDISDPMAVDTPEEYEKSWGQLEGALRSLPESLEPS
jgi:protein-tyrosine phosphatase